MKTNNFLIFIILLLLTFFSSYITSKYIITIDVLYNSLSEQLIEEQLLKFIENQEKFEWIKYIFASIIILLRSVLVALTLSMGVFLFDFEIDISFKKLFGITLIGEFVFILAEYSKILYFLFLKNDYLLEDLQRFYPLSIINIIGYSSLDSWWVYPLQVLNLFELSYWLILAYLLGKILKINLNKSMKIVASSYGVVLLIWIVGIMFLTLNMN